MRIIDRSSDVCSSDLWRPGSARRSTQQRSPPAPAAPPAGAARLGLRRFRGLCAIGGKFFLALGNSCPLLTPPLPEANSLKMQEGQGEAQDGPVRRQTCAGQGFWPPFTRSQTHQDGCVWPPY